MAISETILLNTTVTASGSTPAFPADAFSTVSADVSVSAIGGTTPSYTFQLQASPDGVNWFNIGAATGAVTTNTGTTITSGQGLFDGAFARVTYAIAR